MNNDKAELLQAIKDAIRDALLIRDVSASEIIDQVGEEKRHLIESLGSELGFSAFRRMVQDLMKHVTATAEAARDPQMKLIDLPDLPPSLSYEKDGDVRYVARFRAKRWHYVAQLDLLDEQIRADTAKRNAVKPALDFLDPLFEQYGDLTTAEVLTLHQQSEMAS